MPRFASAVEFVLLSDVAASSFAEVAIYFANFVKNKIRSHCLQSKEPDHSFILEQIETRGKATSRFIVAPTLDTVRLTGNEIVTTNSSTFGNKI